jgi:alpha-beta hydrolase superfamily lysophospholipase
LVDNGFRVISFDLPSHGENSGLLNEINLFPFTRLIDLLSSVERFTRILQSRPLILSGWSTGGLIVTRLVQSFSERLDRKVNGVILFTPGVSVHTLIGENGFVTVRTLTR